MQIYIYPIPINDKDRGLCMLHAFFCAKEEHKITKFDINETDSIKKHIENPPDL